MVALLVVLFFGATGLTLNHPAWTFGDDAERTTTIGTLPFDPTDDGSVDGQVQYLLIAEHVRSVDGVSGSVDSFGLVGEQGSIVFKNPGYAAEVTFDLTSRSYEVTVDQQGWVGVLNDLHKGRDAGSAWRWVIDVAAVLLVIISLTGLVMQLFLRRNRTAALVTLGVGAVLTVILAWITMI
jgi:hypothetical protein